MHKLICTILLACPLPLLAEQQATVRQTTPLLQRPAADARQLAELAGSEKLSILLRQGGWYQVAPRQKPQGWVRLFALQFEQARYQPDNLPLQDLQGLVRPGHNQITSTTGVRGLDKVAIESARPDFAALQQMQKLQLPASSLQAFVSDGLLHSNPAIALKEAAR